MQHDDMLEPLVLNRYTDYSSGVNRQTTQISITDYNNVKNSTTMHITSYDNGLVEVEYEVINEIE